MSLVSSLSLLFSLPVPPTISCTRPAHKHTHMPFPSPPPAAVPCTDSAVALSNDYLLKCHYKKWGVMLSPAGVYWRVNVCFHTWNTSLTQWIFTALQHGGTGRD